MVYNPLINKYELNVLSGSKNLLKIRTRIFWTALYLTSWKRHLKNIFMYMLVIIILFSRNRYQVITATYILFKH